MSADGWLGLRQLQGSVIRYKMDDTLLEFLKSAICFQLQQISPGVVEDSHMLANPSDNLSDVMTGVMSYTMGTGGLH